MAIQISNLAREDLENIRAYTIATWGRAQWLTYYRQIVRAFDRIAAHPDAGRDRSLFVSGMRSINCDKHVIFYKRLETSGGALVVLRIIHQKRHMSALAYYDDLDGD